MSNFYAEGVDLKVAEKYRVPRISVPGDVIAHVCSEHYPQVVASSQAEYDFSLERNVIQKIEEWRRVHDQEEHVRQEQLRARDRERRQLIEQEQKHLLNQVSYPSTDDLSSSSDERENHSPEDESRPTAATSTVTETKGVANGGDTTESLARNKVVPLTAPSVHRDFSMILQPTVVPEGVAGTTNPFRLPSNKSHGGSSKDGVLNYSEWESDNYSPFDRMELKSINDLDILAQVLQTTQLNNKSPVVVDDNKESPKSPPASPVATEETKIVVKEEKVENVPVPPPSVPVTSENSPETVTYSWTTNTTSQQHQPNVTETFPPYQHLHHQPVAHHQLDYAGQPQQQLPGNNVYYNHNHNHQQQYHSNIPSYNVHNPLAASNYPQYANNYHYQATTTTTTSFASNGRSVAEPEDRGTSSSSLLRSRSKSVPDIVNELEEEVKASEQRRRVRNHSQCNRAAVENDEEEASGNTDDSDAFERLPADSKDLAVKISRMGFPVNVVATVIEQLGNDDKKIIEHLIPLSELLDLGFGISPTSEALLKFNNNRERALDFLIS